MKAKKASVSEAERRGALMMARGNLGLAIRDLETVIQEMRNSLEDCLWNTEELFGRLEDPIDRGSHYAFRETLRRFSSAHHRLLDLAVNYGASEARFDAAHDRARATLGNATVTKLIKKQCGDLALQALRDAVHMHENTEGGDERHLVSARRRAVAVLGEKDVRLAIKQWNAAKALKRLSGEKPEVPL